MSMYFGWRGTVGIVKPSYRPHALQDFMNLVPDGVAVIPNRLGAREGSDAEFERLGTIVEERVAELVDVGADVVVISGTPITTTTGGLEGDAKLRADLEKKHGVPILTATQMAVDSFHALGVKRMLIIDYIADQVVRGKFAQLFRDAGFKVTGHEFFTLEGSGVPFGDLGKIPPQEVYAFAKKAYLNTPDVDAIYLLGSGWRVLPIVEVLENDLNTTVVTNLSHELWGIRKQLHIDEPLEGYGRLLRELP
jgi:maleate cis-trans isomerase